MQPKKIVFTLLITMLISGRLIANEANDSTNIQLNNVEVIGHRTNMYSEMSRLITTIDKVEITKSAAQSIDQLLDYVAGIDIRQRGNNTTQADISIRGGSFDQVLILINGVNITDAQTGHFNLDLPISIADISKIEVLRGSAARVLGSNAFSGAINIITKPDPQNGLNALFTGGSFNSFGQAISNSSGNQKVRTQMSVAHRSSDGYTYNTEYDMTNAFGHTVINSENTGQLNIQLAGQLKTFGANSFYSLTFPNQYERTKTYFSSVSWLKKIYIGTLNVQAYWREHHDRFELDFKKPAGWNYHKTNTLGGKINYELISILGKTSVGVELRNEHILSNTLGEKRDSLKIPFEESGYYTKETERLLTSGLLNHSVAIGNFYTSAGISGTHTKKYGMKYAGGADISYLMAEKSRVYVSYNSAVRLPTFTDIYLITSVQQANPNIQPEYSQTIEGGGKFGIGNFNVEGALYYRAGKNIIDWIKESTTDVIWKSKNIKAINALGADITASYHFNKFIVKRISASYSYLQLNKKAVGFDSKYALDYLKNKLVVSIDHSIIGKLSASWKGSWFDREGTYTNRNKAIVKFSPYALLDTRLTWTDRKFDLFADANNILDKKYEDYGGLLQPGFNFNIGVRVKL